MVLPNRLEKGDTIGVFSPSYPASASWTGGEHPSVAFLERQGFRVKRGRLTGKRDFYRSGCIAERADELNELIADPDVKCLMAVSGGYVSNSLLPYIEYGRLRDNPKIVIGFSDVTAILLAVYAQTGLVTFYGPVLSVFGRKPPLCLETYRYMSAMIARPPGVPYLLPTPARWTEDYIDAGEDVEYTMRDNRLTALSEGASEGRLIACNLNALPGFMASKFMPEIVKGDILLVEDKNLDAESVERGFSMLKVCGVFDKIGGLIVGKHIDFDDRQTGRKHTDILREVMGRAPFPVLTEFDCSHAMPMLTMPIGCRVRLDATARQVTLLQPCVR